MAAGDVLRDVVERTEVSDHVGDIELMRLALRGWELFAGGVPADVAEPVIGLLDDPHPLVAALRQSPTREDLIGWYRSAAGPACDDRAMHLALLSGMVRLGWNKALDAVEHRTRRSGPGRGRTSTGGHRQPGRHCRAE